MYLAKANSLKHPNSKPNGIDDRKDTRERVLEEENKMSNNQHNYEARQVPENSGVIGETSNYTHVAKQKRIEETTNSSRDMKQQKKKADKRDETDR
ncbi:hypothetical protein V6N13_114746 [Hibiscus sabdariffa]|uniref:Uncharacterized protein n=1 Tax=Hibiscus sabdariffa TaxID=183260 RepID=A0ABR2U317_9ROSI